MEMSPAEKALVLTKVDERNEVRERADGRRMGLLRSVPVQAIFATAWHPGRLEQCRSLLAEGKRPPPIKVVGLRRLDRRQTMFVVSDGMHRTVAARKAGKKLIRAEIEGWSICDPRSFILWKNVLWNTVSDYPHHRQANHRPLTPEVASALVDLGVRVVPNHMSPFA